MTDDEARRLLNEKVTRTLESLEPSYADLANHDCSTHPKITHARWLQCQHEIRAILAGTPDPEMKAAKRAEEDRRRRAIEDFERFMRRDDRAPDPPTPPDPGGSSWPGLLALAVIVGLVAWTLWIALR